MIDLVVRIPLVSEQVDGHLGLSEKQESAFTSLNSFPCDKNQMLSNRVATMRGLRFLWQRTTAGDRLSGYYMGWVSSPSLSVNTVFCA